MKRILFVDDDARVLEGLRRMLHGLRAEWEMHFVESGREALRLLDESELPFDVVVTDMRMPGMDGAALLKEVRARHPGVVRLVLSGHAELELAMRSEASAHQFLTKPCDSGHLKSVVTRSLALHQRLLDARLRDVVGKLRSLPVLPATYAELNLAMADEEVTIRAVADIVARDCGIAAKTLQLVNSSFFGFARRVESLQEAVAYIGLANIRTLVLQYGMIHAFDAASAAPSFSIEEHHRHALSVAKLARAMHSADPHQAEQSFLAGMLHDIGRLVLATNLPELFERAERIERTSGVPLHELERRAISVTHAEVGAYLLGIWGMPDPIVETAERHHEPSLVLEGASFDALAAVHIADALIEEAADPDGPPRLDRAFVRHLGLEERLGEWRRLAYSLPDRPRGRPMGGFEAGEAA